MRQSLGATKEILCLRLRRVPFPPVAPSLGDTGVFIGASNSAGQGWAWARALEKADPSVRVVNARFEAVNQRTGFQFEVDQPIYSHYAAHSARWQRSQFAALRNYRAVLIESGDAILARMFEGDTIAQVKALTDSAVKVAFLFHGSDIRDPDRHIKAEQYSHFTADPGFADEFRKVTARNREILDAVDAPVFVSTPDLLNEIDGAIWLPVVVEVERWESAEPPVRRGIPLRVAHVPSNSMVKGTELAIPTLARLAEEGIISYQEIRGVPHAEMPDIYRTADIVIDQLRVGIYGVATCEALAAGRIVVSHVSDRVRAVTKEVTGENLPVVEATADTLYQVLKDIAENPGPYLELAAAGPGFVRRNHDGTRSGAVLQEWLDS